MAEAGCAVSTSIELQIEAVRGERDFAASYAKAAAGTPFAGEADAHREALAAAVRTLEGVAVLQRRPLALPVELLVEVT